MATPVRLEYGDTFMEVELPDSARVVRAAEILSDPEPLVDPVAATRQALDNPLGSPPISELVGPGDKVAIAFPDRVKGGTQTTAHRRVTIPLLLEQLAGGGLPTRISPWSARSACTGRTRGRSSAPIWATRSLTVSPARGW